VLNLAEAAARTDIKFLLFPNEDLPEQFLSHVLAGLRSGDMLVFASGYSAAFGYIEPPAYVDVVMIAPSRDPQTMRKDFKEGRGFFSYLGVHQDATGRAWQYLLAMAKAVGALRVGALEISFRQQAELDLFVKQSVIATIQHLLVSAAELLLHEGYPDEAVMLELYLSGELGSQLGRAAQLGMVGLIKAAPKTDQFAMLAHADRILENKFRRQLERSLDDIRQGRFAQEWTSELSGGTTRLQAMIKNYAARALWQTEQQTMQFLERGAAQGDPSLLADDSAPDPDAGDEA
jgi:ketol-acid reductoisomerase